MSDYRMHINHFDSDGKVTADVYRTVPQERIGAVIDDHIGWGTIIKVTLTPVPEEVQL